MKLSQRHDKTSMWVILRRIVLAAAIVIGLAVVHSQILVSPSPVWVGASASVAALFCLGGMRHPWFFLALVVALNLVLPTVHDSSAHDLFMGCLTLSWVLGSLSGWIIRSLSSWRRKAEEAAVRKLE